MKQKTTEIYIATQERIIFRQTTAHEIETVCAACAAASVFSQSERAAFIFNLKMREIYRRIERGTIHFLETATGAMLVCSASISITTDERANLDSPQTNALSNSPLQA